MTLHISGHVFYVFIHFIVFGFVCSEDISDFAHRRSQILQYVYLSDSLAVIATLPVPYTIPPFLHSFSTTPPATTTAHARMPP